MGWMNCGQDSEGRYIGYGHRAECDHPECSTRIDRGLSYACGGMHGTDDQHGTSGSCCEKYFCGKHLESCIEVKDDDGKQRFISVCAACVKQAPECGQCSAGSHALNDVGHCMMCVEGFIEVAREILKEA